MTSFKTMLINHTACCIFREPCD